MGSRRPNSDAEPDDASAERVQDMRVPTDVQSGLVFSTMFKHKRPRRVGGVEI